MVCHQFAAAVYFVFFIAWAWIRPYPGKVRIRVAVPGVIGLFLNTLAGIPWIPAVVMLFAYWQAGQFFERPNLKLQGFLNRLDSRLLPGNAGQAGGYLLELAYLCCYPLIPAGLAALWVLNLHSAIPRYWCVVLLSALLCYGTAPFLQTLPPRALKTPTGDANRTPVRMANLWILRHLSIQANTIPSGHVAAATAATLVIVEVAPATGYFFGAITFLIAVGSVFRRYHYALDAVLGFALAVIVRLAALAAAG